MDIATSTLTIVNVAMNDTGDYTCSVAYSDELTITSTSDIATLSGVGKFKNSYCANLIYMCVYYKFTSFILIV